MAQQAASTPRQVSRSRGRFVRTIWRARRPLQLFVIKQESANLKCGSRSSFRASVMRSCKNWPGSISRRVNRTTLIACSIACSPHLGSSSALLTHLTRYDLVFFDVSPSLGALNRAVMLSSEIRNLSFAFHVGETNFSVGPPVLNPLSYVFECPCRARCLPADAVHEPGQSIVLKDRQALRGSCPQRATASRSGLFGSATLQTPEQLCHRQSSASPDHGAGVRRRSRPRIRRGD